jgi:hypothetical protein
MHAVMGLNITSRSAVVFYGHSLFHFFLQQHLDAQQLT